MVGVTWQSRSTLYKEVLERLQEKQIPSGRSLVNLECFAQRDVFHRLFILEENLERRSGHAETSLADTF